MVVFHCYVSLPEGSFYGVYIHLKSALALWDCLAQSPKRGCVLAAKSFSQWVFCSSGILKLETKNVHSRKQFDCCLLHVEIDDDLVTRTWGYMPGFSRYPP